MRISPKMELKQRKKDRRHIRPISIAPAKPSSSKQEKEHGIGACIGYVSERIDRPEERRDCAVRRWGEVRRR
jgi:hypothetical protein